ncbi:coiled-coil domain-containing protein lobo-like isoform X2 [Polistes fuscatus]|uniref:coiled-coil domain-containing protein lobo-like isoform X2 n=1 Tax=Polistes fuscatus TaxID=30207 RepID=UPI001CA94F28|nr:coiled-coil domain-containing protein lobo-like isoform X2 [Polistes fuscatus]
MLPVRNSFAISGLESKKFNNDENQIKDGEYNKYEDEDFNELDDKLTAISITSNILRKIQRELGLIRLCWPEKDIREEVYLSTLPNSYCNLNDKEKLLLLYAENFRRQFHFKYKKRKPILLACENECGVQKFVSVSIKRSTLPYPELNNWQGCAKFASDFLIYEPHNNNVSLLTRRKLL